MDDSPRVYNPATEWQMRLKATLYSPEEREFAEGERIQLTRSKWDQGIRVGNLATIEQNPRRWRPLGQSGLGSQHAAHP